MSSQRKPRLNLIIIGHVDHGKSTMMGHLLYLTGAVDKRKFKEIEEMAEKMGKESWKYAWILDKFKEERERGLTIDLAFLKFESKKYEFTIIDAPGHRDFVKNMITGASQADAAILVVSAKQGEYEAGISAAGQTREHIFLASTMGIRQMVVAVNKMDTVNYEQKRYEEVKQGISKLLKIARYNPAKVPFIPVSGLKGDNLVERSPNMPWYKGPTLIEALDLFEEPPRPVDKPLRIPIQDVYSITGVGTVPVGRVETGVLKPGDRVIFMPPKKVGEVKSIEIHHRRVDQAIPGDNIGFNVKGIARDEIRRGDVCGHTNNPPTVAEEFVGKIWIFYHPTAIGVGYTPVLHIHTATVPVRFTELIAKIDPRTGATIEEHPSYLRQGDFAVVRFKPLKPVVVELRSEFEPLGRFAIRDSGRTIAAGIVTEVKKAQI
ncbi:MAG: translation elongation factor EF-1 subunit alpha [Thermoprotei archaeon]|nr:MAG: translation elongation factor EF-1 subunit alpha [Thermofilum sp. ex4484_79]RLE61749.1 MAG: translation elongation factor EF-1 subunit alpha [Thermoprotei archaeon]HDD63569.1 translation elongation factor EF-1 subunit alpha [Thermoprotei archaeon]